MKQCMEIYGGKGKQVKHLNNGCSQGSKADTIQIVKRELNETLRFIKAYVARQMNLSQSCCQARAYVDQYMSLP